jgi:hypothetical protein
VNRGTTNACSGQPKVVRLFAYAKNSPLMSTADAGVMP